MDWRDCPEIEVVAGKVGGRPVIKGTRVEPDVILVDEGYGRSAEQTHASFSTVTADTIVKICAFAHKHQLQP